MKKTYQLYLKVDGNWLWTVEIEAEDHRDALRKTISIIRPEHYALPLKLEQDDALKPTKEDEDIA